MPKKSYAKPIGLAVLAVAIIGGIAALTKSKKPIAATLKPGSAVINKPDATKE